MWQISASRFFSDNKMPDQTKDQRPQAFIYFMPSNSYFIFLIKYGTQITQNSYYGYHFLVSGRAKLGHLKYQTRRSFIFNDELGLEAEVKRNSRGFFFTLLFRCSITNKLCLIVNNRIAMKTPKFDIDILIASQLDAPVHKNNNV